MSSSNSGSKTSSAQAQQHLERLSGKELLGNSGGFDCRTVRIHACKKKKRRGGGQVAAGLRGLFDTNTHPPSANMSPSVVIGGKCISAALEA